MEMIRGGKKRGAMLRSVEVVGMSFPERFKRDSQRFSSTRMPNLLRDSVPLHFVGFPHPVNFEILFQCLRTRPFSATVDLVGRFREHEKDTIELADQTVWNCSAVFHAIHQCERQRV